MSNKKLKDIETTNGRQIITAPVVFKKFTRKNAETMDYYEMYIQRSIQDYFIKFCESKISRRELETHLAKNKSTIKTATLEVEFLEGNWDICDKNELQQSRIGPYVVIHKIIDD